MTKLGQFSIASLTLLCLLSVSERSFARAGGGAGAAATGLKSPGPAGLCTGDTENQRKAWVDKGWCKALFESVRGKDGGCERDNFNKLAQKIRSNQINGFKEWCPQIDSFKRDEDVAMVLTQIVSTLIISESMWKQNAVGPSLKGRHAQGLMQLSADSIKSYKCGGCNSGISDSALKDDAFKSLRCGTYIALSWMEKDSQVGGGSGKRSRGIARYFQPFREIDKQKREVMKKKVANYCETRKGDTSRDRAITGGGGSGDNNGSR